MASRGLSAGNLSASQAGTTYPVYFWYGDFASGAVRVTSYVKQISWGGYDWTALGDFMGFGEIRETEDPQANSVEFFLNGVSSSLLTKALEAGYRRRACALYIGFLDTSEALVSTPIAFPYIMDRMPIRRNGEDSKITVIAESRLVDMQRSSELRYTDIQQQYLYSGDRFFEYVEGIETKDVPVGAAVDGGKGAASAALKPSFNRNQLL